MNNIQITSIVETSVSLALLVALLLEFWPEARLDAFRQDMFALRDELFDFADAGNIAFSHPSYKLLRRSMNGFIRFAHQLTFFRLCVTLLGWKFGLHRPKLGWALHWSESLQTISDGGSRSSMEAFHSRALSLVFWRLVSSSPILLSAVAVVTFTTVLNVGWKNLRQACRSAIGRVIEWIVDPRMIEEEAMRVSS